jgi:hypothetical protein
MCFCRGGSWKVIRPSNTARLKIEDVYNLRNMIEIFHLRKVTKTKRGKSYDHFKLQITLAQLCKTHLFAYVDIQILPLLRGEINRLVCFSLMFYEKKNTMLVG